MSATKPAPRSVAAYIAVLEDEIMRSQTRGLPGDWNGLRRRLGALSQKVTGGEAAGASTHTPTWAQRLEHGLWVETLQETLLPAVVDDLVEILRSQRGQADLGIWAPLDREAMVRHRRQQSLADAAVLAALKQHAKKPSHLRILEGLRALEDLHSLRARLDPGSDPELLADEGKHLCEALETLLPPTARQLLGCEVEVRFRSQIEDKAIEQLNPSLAHWHNHLPGVGIWCPLWNQLLTRVDEPVQLGSWFVPNAQAVYAKWHTQAEADRAKEAADEKRKQRAAAAKQRRQERKEADQRALQARLDKEELDRKQKQEREQRAEVERAEQRITLEREQQQKEQRADYERQQEEERQARIVMKRQSRGPTPSTPAYWKRRPEEIWRRQAEAEFKRWCQRKGVLPQDFTDEHREKIMREIC